MSFLLIKGSSRNDRDLLWMIATMCLFGRPLLMSLRQGALLSLNTGYGKIITNLVTFPTILQSKTQLYLDGTASMEMSNG